MTFEDWLRESTFLDEPAPPPQRLSAKARARGGLGT